MSSVYCVLKQFLLLILGRHHVFWHEPPIYCWPGRDCVLQVPCFKHIHKHIFIGSKLLSYKKHSSSQFQNPSSFLQEVGDVGRAWTILEMVTSWSISGSVSLKMLLVFKIGGLGTSWKRSCRVQCVCPQRPQDILHNSILAINTFLTWFLYVISTWL